MLPRGKSLLLTGLLALGSEAQAIDLVGAYNHALEYDAELAAAIAGRNATAENVVISRAGLLPGITLGASVTHHDVTLEKGTDDSYITKGAEVALVQPLLDLDNYHQYEASKHATRQADAQLRSAEQSLIFRTSDAYFTVLRALDNLTTTRRAEDAFKRQWEQARERFEVGLIAITEVHETKAIYDSGKVARINAQGDLDIALENLERITGEYIQTINTLDEDFPVKAKPAGSIGEWESTAFENNPELQAALWDVSTARSNVEARKANHYPVIDARASYTHSDFNGPFPNDNRSEDAAISLNLTVPLYAGGATQAGVRQARHLLDQSEQTLKTVRRNIRVQLRTLFRNLQTNVEAIQARRQEIISNESALQATRAGYDVGTRNIVEVLDAERKYFTSLSNYANARYDFVINQIAFEQTAGTLTVEDINTLNKWLVDPVSVSGR